MFSFHYAVTTLQTCLWIMPHKRKSPPIQMSILCENNSGKIWPLWNRVQKIEVIIFNPDYATQNKCSVWSPRRHWNFKIILLLNNSCSGHTYPGNLWKRDSLDMSRSVGGQRKWRKKFGGENWKDLFRKAKFKGPSPSKKSVCHPDN